jgi:hypothetical protein
MHRAIDAPIDQRLLDLLGEQPLAADIGKAAVLDAIAAGADDHGFDRLVRDQAGCDQHAAYEAGLGQRQRAAARADFELCFHACSLGPRPHGAKEPKQSR